ncbi:DUF4270 domain-containing protein [Bergeyella sp. RCAD1439]|uniref:DUF4270 domain-containing protein n=1 Tax=Bergeyella anatis TaxID=3113737 RepID=UPI002E18A817|nr:DUF4270 domain-containing protein [Bergeyella sp. RCAD1439]
MIKNIKYLVKTSLILCGGSFVLWNCESDATLLGTQFFEGTSAQGVSDSLDVLVYNVSNQDTARTDAAKLTYATLGAFSDDQFGMQRASFVTQARLSTYDPSFGTNAVVDSAVLQIMPLYATDSASVNTYDDYVYPDGDVAAKKVVTSYPITRYGKAKSSMTINVHEVDDFLGGVSDVVYSNKTVNYGTLLGSATIGSQISAVTVTKDSDNSELLKRSAAIRVPLEASFFQNKIVDKAGQSELYDVANFIRYFKGVRLSVAENDGYLLRFQPSASQITIYYKHDQTSDGATTRKSASYTISLGSSNAQFNQFEFNRSGTPSQAVVAQSAPNAQSGDAKIYLQGTGGPGVGIKIPSETVAALRQKFVNDKIGIISAKIRLYSDVSSWNNLYDKPTAFSAAYYDPTTGAKDLSTFLKDFTAFSGSTVYSFIKVGNISGNPSYYDISITQTLREMIEQNAENKAILVRVGGYEMSTASATSTSSVKGPSYTGYAYVPNRVVLVGSDASNERRARLHIIYSKK